MSTMSTRGLNSPQAGHFMLAHPTAQKTSHIHIQFISARPMHWLGLEAPWGATISPWAAGPLRQAHHPGHKLTRLRRAWNRIAKRVVGELHLTVHGYSCVSADIARRVGYLLD